MKTFKTSIIVFFLSINAFTLFGQSSKSKKLKSPVIVEGTESKTLRTSATNGVSIFVYGGKQAERSAKENAKILANAFADTKFTDKPIYITAVHKETDKDQPTVVRIYMNGLKYTKNNANSFTPRQVGGGIDVIMEDYVKKYGDKLIIKENKK